jgi:hypothetical protein
MKVAEAEAILQEWFEAEVVLTSSGRAGLLLCMQAFGLNRYRDRVALPRMISGCVLDAVIRCGFPVDPATTNEANLTLHYHQYGYPQIYRPDGLVLEDICHSFFATPTSGARPWTGKAAVFSLPKFFKTASMVGGIVTTDVQLARQLRAARGHPKSAAPMDLSYSAALSAGGATIEHFYLDRLLCAGVDEADLGGFPRGVNDICRIGQERRAILDRLLSASTADYPPGWLQMLGQSLPFAFPVFGTEEKLAALDQELKRMDVIAGVYSIDIERDMSAPRYRKAVLVPCHGFISRDQLHNICVRLG